MTALQLPYPYFGGKTKIAREVWRRFGDAPNYVEPFFGGGAVFWLRPNYDPLKHTETLNDIDCNISNFLRAIAANPKAVADYASWPINEADLTARHQWLTERTWGYAGTFRESMIRDPDFYDPKQAGWWIWGINQWIGSGWCADPRWSRRNNPRDPELGVYKQRPDLLRTRLPHLGNLGMGIHRKSNRCSMFKYFQKLSDRLTCPRVCCGDFERVLGSGATYKKWKTAVFLDPPYNPVARHSKIYNHDAPDVYQRSWDWAISNGDNPLFRIAFCEYEGSVEFPKNWDCYSWKANGGYANQGEKNSKARANTELERVWFSPHCLKPKKYDQLNLLEATLCS